MRLSSKKFRRSESLKPASISTLGFFKRSTTGKDLQIGNSPPPPNKKKKLRGTAQQVCVLGNLSSRSGPHIESAVGNPRERRVLAEPWGD